MSHAGGWTRHLRAHNHQGATVPAMMAAMMSNNYYLGHHRFHHRRTGCGKK
jgi:hypothetical protein